MISFWRALLPMRIGLWFEQLDLRGTVTVLFLSADGHTLNGCETNLKLWILSLFPPSQMPSCSPLNTRQWGIWKALHFSDSCHIAKPSCSCFERRFKVIQLNVLWIWGSSLIDLWFIRSSESSFSFNSTISEFFSRCGKFALPTILNRVDSTCRLVSPPASRYLKWMLWRQGNLFDFECLAAKHFISRHYRCRIQSRSAAGLYSMRTTVRNTCLLAHEVH